MAFFSIFELIIIIGLLYIAWRFLKADGQALKEKIDKTLTKEKKNGDTTKKS